MRGTSSLAWCCSPRSQPHWCMGSVACSPSTGHCRSGTLVALAALLGRLYGPLTALSNVQVDVMTALVSFERVFEVLDLEPMVRDRSDARPTAGRRPAR